MQRLGAITLSAIIMQSEDSKTKDILLKLKIMLNIRLQLL